MRSLAASAVVTAQALLLVLTFVFFARAASGQFIHPLPGATLFLVVLALLAVAGLYRALHVPWTMPVGVLSNLRSTLAWQLALFAVPTVGLLLMLIPNLLHPQSVAWLILSWIVAIGFELCSWLLLVRPTPGTFEQGGSVTTTSMLSTAGQASSGTEISTQAHNGAVDEVEGLAPDVVQQLTRTCDAEGAETISALLRIAFSAGDPLQVVHLAFCPPLAKAPAVEIEQLEGPEIELRTTVTQTYGTRFEARLTEPAAGEQTAVVQLYASTAAECEVEDAGESEA